MTRLEEIRVEIAELKEKYWTLVNVHRPTARIFNARAELDKQITLLEREECNIENQEA